MATRIVGRDAMASEKSVSDRKNDDKEDFFLFDRPRGVFQSHAIKKVANYVYVMKKFPSTCMLRTRSSLTYIPFWMDSVRT
jgi:hypothetical protein